MNRKQLALAIALATAGVANAAPILYVGDNGGVLATIDVATGTPTAIGVMGAVMYDIAFDPAGNLWGISDSALYRIDKNTGASVLVGATGTFVNALTFNSSGALYAAGGTGFYTIDTTTGAATFVGATGTNSSGDLAFRDGSLYLTGTGVTANDSLHQIDPLTGAGALVGDMGIPGAFGLATAGNNVTYATAGTSIYSVNVATGATTFLVSWGGGQVEGAFGAAFFEEARAPLPGSLALLGLGLAGLAALRRKPR